jgi:hypothetical protein
MFGPDFTGMDGGSGIAVRVQDNVLPLFTALPQLVHPKITILIDQTSGSLSQKLFNYSGGDLIIGITSQIQAEVIPSRKFFHLIDHD